MLTFLFICVSYAWCQQLKKVSGKIVDDLKVPMIGVSVIEKGTSNGVISDLDGNYELQVKEGATIVFSYVGYVTQEKKVTARRCIITHFNFWPLHFLAERGEYVVLFLYIVLSI